MEIVQHTNVFVAALRSLEGASAKVLERCLAHDDPAVMHTAQSAARGSAFHWHECAKALRQFRDARPR